MFFAVFYHSNLAGKLSPVCGSDGVVLIDGRFSEVRANAVARAQAHRLRNVKPHLLGFQLRKGESFSRSRPYGGLKPLTDETLAAFRAAKEAGVVEW